MKAILSIALSFIILYQTKAQTKLPENWQSLDPVKDKVMGCSSDEALKMLKMKGKKGQKIIVAILDTGVDINHEDLKDVIWTNPGEIPGNGKDDDSNGYIDDIHGWNFIAGRDGKNVYHDTYELTREYARESKRFKGTDPKNLYGDVATEYKYYTQVKKGYELERQQIEQEHKFISDYLGTVEDALHKIEKKLGKTIVSNSEFLSLNTNTTAEISIAVATLKEFTSLGFEIKNLPNLKETAMEYNQRTMDYGYNPDYNPRQIVGDDANDLTNKFYGSNDYLGPNPEHGTFLAGIIAADRDNTIGIQGIADNVNIISVRCRPDGDERDKDVANSIFYAVDNGASIIYIPFSKKLSPQKDYVDAALKYAADYDVLVIHDAGKNGEDLDVVPSYPSRFNADGKELKTWLEVGSSTWKSGVVCISNSSNYGKKNVQVFAPGGSINSILPDNKYISSALADGAAGAVAAGVAGIIRSYYPNLSAAQVKDILIKSVNKIDIGVYKPGTATQIQVAELCSSGGILHAGNAIQLADQTKASKSDKAIWREAGMGKFFKKRF